MIEEKLYKTMFGTILTLCVAGIVIGYLHNPEQEKYVVTDKGANKIVYRTVIEPYSQHVMTFDKERPDSRNGFYPYINIGDTISGEKFFMDKPVSESWYYAVMPLQKWKTGPRIKSVNGRNLQELREIARRDSLIRQIKSNQR